MRYSALHRPRPKPLRARDRRRDGSLKWYKVYPVGEPERGHRFGGEDALDAVAKAHRFFGDDEALEWEETR